MTDSNFSEKVTWYFQENKDQLLTDLAGLIAIRSVTDLKTKTDNAPFGNNIRHAFDYLIKIAKREGFTVSDYQGYAIDITYGHGKQEIAILHHVDIVDAGDMNKWNTQPFEMHLDGDIIFGRGTTDNKGPLIGSLYILKLFKDLNIPLNKTIKLIIGGAEETTWECVEHYFKHNPQPDYGFSPDGDFPIVNGEKGILYMSLEKAFPPPNTNELSTCQIVAINCERDRTSTCHQLTMLLSGEKSATVAKRFSRFAQVDQQEGLHRVVVTTPWEKSRNPHKVDNCIDAIVPILRDITELDQNSVSLVQLLNDCFVQSADGSKLGLNFYDDEMGSTTCCISSINLNQHGYSLDFDFRFPKGLTVDHVRTQLQYLSQRYGVNLIEHQYLPLSYLSPESELVQAMGKAYHKATHQDAQCFSKGAASYARALKNGVAFGPTFPGEVTCVHEPNERLNLKSLLKAMTIYVNVLISLQE